MNTHAVRIALAIAALAVAMPAAIAQQCPATVPVEGAVPPGPLPLFPSDNWWNTDISSAPVDAGSPNFIAYINNGGTRRLHPDFGGEASPGSMDIYGMPYAIVDGSQAKQAVTFDYAGRERRRRRERARRAVLSAAVAGDDAAALGRRRRAGQHRSALRKAIATCWSSIARTATCTSCTTSITTRRRRSGTPAPARFST